MKLRASKRPQVEFITAWKHVAEMFPPVPAGRSTPDWWRSTPGFLPEDKRSHPHLKLRRDATVKSCPGLQDFFGLGWVLPLWADLVITAEEQGFDYQISTSANEVGSFMPHEVGAGFPRRPGDHTHVLKITTPWQVRASRGWSLLVLPPLLHGDRPFTVMPGVVDSDRLPVMNVIAEWHSPLGHAELLKAGTPLLHIVPFRRSESPSLEVTQVGRQEWLDSFGPGLDAVEGGRLAPGAYREHARRQKDG